MATSISVYMEYPLPGAQSGDYRLEDIEAVRAALVNIDENLNAHDSRISNANANITTINDNIMNLDVRVGNLENLVTNMQYAIDALQSTVNNLDYAIQGVSNTVNNLDYSVQSISSTVNNNANTISTFISNYPNLLEPAPTAAPPEASYTVTLNSYNVNEGDTLTVTATGGGYYNNTTLAFVTVDNSTGFVLSDVTNWESNHIIIYAGTGSNNSVSITADMLTEGVESFKVVVFDYNLWVANGSQVGVPGPYLGVSPVVTVNDTSTTP